MKSALFKNHISSPFALRKMESTMKSMKDMKNIIQKVCRIGSMSESRTRPRNIQRSSEELILQPSCSPCLLCRNLSSFIHQTRDHVTTRITYSLLFGLPCWYMEITLPYRRNGSYFMTVFYNQGPIGLVPA